MITFFGNDRSEAVYRDWLDANKQYDFVLSCQYPRKLPSGGVNVHYGILPFYRGMNPIYHQMKDGVAGVTLHYMTDRFDDGDIIDIYKFPTYGKTADEVYDECERMGFCLLRKWAPFIQRGDAPRKKQDERFARYYKKDEVNFNEDKKIKGVFFTPEHIQQIFRTHFKGKQYPTIELCGREFELRVK